MVPEVESWVQAAARRQAIVNAVPIPAKHVQRRARNPIPVVARLQWERDGLQNLETEATAWTTRAVLVTIADPRWATRGVWLPPEDVTRR